MADWGVPFRRVTGQARTYLRAVPWYGYAGVGAAALLLLSRRAGAAEPAGVTRPGGTPATMKLGSAGPWASYLQSLLGLTPTGAVDAATVTAVKAFQKAHGLAADGVVGPKTWAALGVTQGGGPTTQPPGTGPGTTYPPPDIGAAGDPFDLSDSIAEREKQILDYVAAGSVDVEWVPVSWSQDGHEVTVFVTRRALALANGQGDRTTVSVSFRTAQKIADLLGAAMLTTRMSDEIYKQAQRKVSPLTRPITSKTADMIDQSRRIDDAVGGADGLVANEGKDWVLTRRWWTPPAGTGVQKPEGQTGSLHNAANFGWYGAGTSKSPGGAQVIQSIGLAHDKSHVDYSQLWRGVQPTVLVDGQPRLLGSVLLDPELSHLFQDEGGTLPGVRHPDL